MTNLDPLAISIVTEAVSFLFDQASKTLQDVRDKRNKSGAKENAPKSAAPNTDKNNVLRSITGELDVEEIKHCRNQIHAYTKNVHAFETQIAMYGGEQLAPPDLVQKLEISQNELQKSIYKLKQILESASQQEIRIAGLD